MKYFGIATLFTGIAFASGFVHAAPPSPPMKKANTSNTMELPRWPSRADPQPMVTRYYLELSLVLAKKSMTVEKVILGSFEKPRALLPRFRGRFEARLYTTQVLRDVIRFNFPMTGDTEEKRPDLPSLNLGKGVSARVKILVPFDVSITDGVIVDSLHKSTVKIPLPHLPTNKAIPDGESLRTRSFRSSAPNPTPPSQH